MCVSSIYIHSAEHETLYNCANTFVKIIPRITLFLLTFDDSSLLCLFKCFYVSAFFCICVCLCMFNVSSLCRDLRSMCAGKLCVAVTCVNNS